MSDCPLISVIIPAYNGEDYLAQAISSIINQDYPNHEIWVIDNGSTDRTRDIAHSFSQVNYRCSDIANTALARNRGLELATGEYIAFLDQDDLWVQDKTSKQLHFLVKNPEYSAVIGLQELFLQPGCNKPHWLKQTFLEQPQLGYLPSTLMMRKSLLSRISAFDTTFALASDVAWFFKAKQLDILIGELPEVVLRRRVHNDNTSNKVLAVQKDILAVIKHSLCTRRETCHE